MTIPSRADALALDAADPLALYRDEFALPSGVIYLDGNSLGARPHKALARAADLIAKEWGDGLVRSWNAAGWFDMPGRLGDRLAALIGAGPGEVVITDSTGIDLFKVLNVALDMRPQRRVILMESDNFPTDVYMAEGLVRLRVQGLELRLVPGDEIASAVDETVAVVAVTQVNYKTGRRLDIKALAAGAHEKGALFSVDLCHSAGAFPVDLADWQVDMAVGCTYKYLNGGPGSPGFLYLPKRHQGQAVQPLSGWWGHADPFAFEPTYRPAKGIQQMLSGTQGVLSMAMVEIGLEIFERADMNEIRAKSAALGDLFIRLMDECCGDQGFALNSPRDALRRGSQVSVNHENGHAIMHALIARGVIGDFRAPQNMRFGFTPLYTRYVDIWDAVEVLHDIMATKAWDRPEYHARDRVT